MKKKLTIILLILFNTIVQAQQRVTFSDQFKKQNQGIYSIQIHEVKELLQIMVAITHTGKENDDMVQQEGAYYKDMVSYFKRYENEKIIRTFDSLMVVSPYYYVFLTGNGIAYDFKGNKLLKSEVYNFPATSVAGFKITENPITKYQKEIEDFAKKSRFRSFYKKHQKYYTEIIADYNKNANLGKQWKWLENNFKTKINSYIIFCSPLVNGFNYTDEFKDNDFRLIYMNLPPLDKKPELSALQNEIFNTRIMFTEIDHNYVEAPSHENKIIINNLFKNRENWLNEKIYGVSAYPNAIKVFNEYMTFGVFLLYAKEHYNTETFNQTYKEVIRLMAERGFFKMQDFTDQLLRVQAENQHKKIDDWYLDFLKYFEH